MNRPPILDPAACRTRSCACCVRRRMPAVPVVVVLHAARPGAALCTSRRGAGRRRSRWPRTCLPMRHCLPLLPPVRVAVPVPILRTAAAARHADAHQRVQVRFRMPAGVARMRTEDGASSWRPPMLGLHALLLAGVPVVVSSARTPARRRDRNQWSGGTGDDGAEGHRADCRATRAVAASQLSRTVAWPAPRCRRATPTRPSRGGTAAADAAHAAECLAGRPPGASRGACAGGAESISAATTARPTRSSPVPKCDPGQRGCKIS